MASRSLLVLFLCVDLGSRTGASQQNPPKPVLRADLRVEGEDGGFPRAPGWFSGDTHEHIQWCDQTAHPLSEIRDRMEAEDLDVASVLIWDYFGVPFTEFVCNVTGEIDPLSTENRILQFGVETSFLSCGRWGHLIGLNIGPEQARIIRGSVTEGACADMLGLGLGGDGSGALNAVAAQHFYSAPSAVCGYAHTVWSTGIHHPLGHDWNAQLLASGFTTDAVYLDPAQKLAVPNVAKLMGIGYPLSPVRDFHPLLGAMDAALGNVQFFETIVTGPDLPVGQKPPSHWLEPYYKLLSAGVRIALSGGTDRACLSFAGQEHVRTYVLTGKTLTYDDWTKGLAAGRTSIAAGPGRFLRFWVGEAEVGGEVRLFSPDARASVHVELQVTGPVDDGIELIVNGEVRDARPVVRPIGGSLHVTFDQVPFDESSWVAVRLASLQAHTAAVYVIVDGRPIVDPLAAEYWMVWCDIVTKTTLDHPQLAFFKRQSAEALALVAKARRAFKSLRDVHGFDPAWEVTRYGVSIGACRGPIVIGASGPARSGESLLLTCSNAPPLAEGVVYLSRAQETGTCDSGVFSYVRMDPGSLIGAFPAQSTRSGYAEVLIPSVPDSDPVLYAQFVWTNPPECAGETCSGGTAALSASDALSLVVHEPFLTSLAVTPTNPTIALGTEQQFTAIGTFSNGTTQDLTGAVAWSSSDDDVATVSNATANAGLATSESVGTTTIAATDTGSGIDGATTLTVTPAVLVSIEVTPTNPSIALGTEQQFTAIGIFSDGTKQDLTASVTWSSSNLAVATTSNDPESTGLATSHAEGTTTITATDTGSGIGGATTLTITPAVLVSIEVTPANPSIALGTRQQFTAIGVFTDATTQDLTRSVVWSSSDPGVASVSNDPKSEGLANGLSLGTATIAATEVGSGIGGATTLTITPAVLVSIEVTPTNPSIALGTQQQFTATGIYTDATTQDLTGAVTWSSSIPVVAAISNAPGSQGLATSVSIGGTTIGALEPASGVSGATTLTVTPAVLSSIEVTPTNPSIPLGTSQQFTAIGVYTDTTTQDLTGVVTWSSSDPGVAAISNAPGSEGLATSVSAGVTTIAALDPLSGVSGATTLTVTPAALVALHLSPVGPSIALGFTQQFTAIGTYTDATTRDLTSVVTWGSSDPGVATISNAPGSQGLVSSFSEGETDISATNPESTITVLTTLTVTPAILLAIEVTPVDPSVALGFSQQFTAIGTYSDSTTRDLTDSVTWSSLNDAVATVSNAPGSRGLATSVAVGVTTIAATDPENAVGGSTTLTVTPAILLAIEVLPADASLTLGFSRQFTAYGTYSDATILDLTSTVTWSSFLSAVATVSNAPGSQGLATSVSQGVTTISATDPESGVSGATTLTVTPPILLALEVTPADPSIALGFSRQFTATGTYSDATTQDLTGTVEWASSNAAVATVGNTPGSQGLASSVSPGVTTITATDPESGVSGATTLTVTPPILLALEVTPADPSIALGFSRQFTATGTYSDATTQDLTGTVEWASSNAAVATVGNTPGSQGLASSVSPGVTTITATDVASGVSGATTLTVTPPILVAIQVTPVNPTIGLGLGRQFTATGTYSDASTQDLTGSVEWNSSNGSVATISNAPGSQGLASSAGVGTTTITATDLASGISGATTLTVKAILLSLQVTPANPAIVEARTKQFIATGTFNDGTTQDITTLVLWSSSNTAVATVGVNGLASGLSGGTSSIAATDPETGIVVATTLTVVPKR